MKKVSITNLKNGMKYFGSFSSDEEMNTWINNCKAVNAWGLSERLKKYDECSEEEIVSAIEIIEAVTQSIEVDDETKPIYGNPENPEEITGYEKKIVESIITPRQAKLSAEYEIVIEDMFNEIKSQKLKDLAELSLSKRRAFCDDYVEQFAIAGYYEDSLNQFPKVIQGVTINKAVAFKTKAAFQAEYYRVKALIEAATDEAGLEAAFAQANFPTGPVA